VLLALRGGTPAEVTALFAGLALCRAPYTLAIGLVSPLTGRLTALVVDGRLSELRRVQTFVWTGTAFLSALGGLLGALIGPWLLRSIFGAQVVLSRPVAALLAVGSAVALANLVQTVALLAHNRSGAVTRAWLVGLAGGTAVELLVASDPLDQTAVAFAVTEVVAFVAFAVEVLGAARRVAQPEPDLTAAVSPS
jgi:O-antigen/teichoic acid export membrane protein